MLTVDNSGEGECMYFAYVISLAYYLRTKNPKIAETVFSNLGLSPSQKFSLLTLLSINRDQAFSRKDIQSIIEPVLGGAARALAGERTFEEFNADPAASSFFTAATYGMEYYIKQAMQAEKSDLAPLINHGFTNPNFTAAEIYRVAGMHAAMKEFATLRLPYVIEEYKKAWPKRQHVLEEEERLSKDNTSFFQGDLLNEIIQQETIAFFKANDNKRLLDYKAHLQKKYVWGTEETLNALHRAVQGEHFVRNKEGLIETFYDTEIRLHIYTNGGHNKRYKADDIPDMILNNSYNVHWTSIIPNHVYSPNSTYKEPSSEKNRQENLHKQAMFKLLDDMKVARDNIPKSHEEYAVAHKLIDVLDEQLLIIILSSSLPEKEKALDRALELIAEASPLLGHYQTWAFLFKNFFTAMLEGIQTWFKGESRSELVAGSLYNEGRRTELTCAVDKAANKLVDALAELNKSTNNDETSLDTMSLSPL